jgi:arabinogalactan endo-1,4-beta-galactosidase
MEKIFVLASARSGTKFLKDLFKYNVKNCISKHESFPDMFGKPIYWYYQGRSEEIRKYFLLKKKIIDRYKQDIYLESNHAFLKSYCDIAMEYFPNMKLIHLIRNPIKVAKSDSNKHFLHERTHIPFQHYKGTDGIKHFRWALTGHEDIFKNINISNPTLFQKYVIQWIEIENRAIKFLDTYKKHNDCYTLLVPEDINDRVKLMDMFNFFKLELKNNEIIIRGSKNQNIIPTIITDEDKRQFKEIIDKIPNSHLEIFKNKPYKDIKWINLLMKNNA